MDMLTHAFGETHSHTHEAITRVEDLLMEMYLSPLLDLFSQSTHEIIFMEFHKGFTYVVSKLHFFPNQNIFISNENGSASGFVIFHMYQDGRCPRGKLSARYWVMSRPRIQPGSITVTGAF